MRWLFLVIGGIATAAMLLISMRLNSPVRLSRSDRRPRRLGLRLCERDQRRLERVGTYLYPRPLYRAKRQWSVVGAAAIWGVCFSYSISSALGVAIEDQSSRTGSRETILMNYDETVVEEKRAPGEAQRTSQASLGCGT